MARRHVGSSQRRSTSWLPIPAQASTFSTTGGIILASLDAGELAKRPFTIIRVHLEVLVITDQLAADESQAFAVGMCVVSDQAQAIGVTAVPTPDTDLGSDLWFLHQFMFRDFAFGSAVGFDSGAQSRSIESKAMRKVNDDQDVLLVGELVANAAGTGFVVLIGGRVLIKEH